MTGNKLGIPRQDIKPTNISALHLSVNYNFCSLNCSYTFVYRTLVACLMKEVKHNYNFFFGEQITVTLKLFGYISFILVVRYI